MAFAKGYKPWNKGKTGIKTSNKGYKHSEATRIQMSKTRIERGILPPNRKGIPHTIDHKRKIGEANKKAYSSLILRQQISDRQKGSKAYWWKGGITALRNQIRQCFKYRLWRSDVFHKNDFTCQICSKRGGRLSADHYPKSFSAILDDNKIKSLEEAENCEEFWDINNGRTLCYPCHFKTENYGGKSRKKK